MATVKLKGISAVEKNIEETLGKVVNSTQMRSEIGQFVVDRIKGEARRGRPLNDTGDLPDLKTVTKEIREELSKINPTHPAFRADRSNLTFSGQLVDAVVYSLKAGGLILFEVAATRRRLVREFDDTFDISKQTLNKKKSQQTKTNKQVDRDLRRRGFALYTAEGLEKNQIIGKRINNIVKKFVRRAIKVNFKS